MCFVSARRSRNIRPWRCRLLAALVWTTRLRLAWGQEAHLTKRLYREYPEDTTFWGRIVSVVREDDHLSIELEQTLFYPTSGGQACDLGTLNTVPVLDVVEQGSLQFSW